MCSQCPPRRSHRPPAVLGIRQPREFIGDVRPARPISTATPSTPVHLETRQDFSPGSLAANVSWRAVVVNPCGYAPGGEQTHVDRLPRQPLAQIAQADR